MAAGGKKHPNGLWIGKRKYQITRSQPVDFNGMARTVVMCNRRNAGAILCKTADSIVLALYAEEGPAGRQAMPARLSPPSCSMWRIMRESSTEWKKMPFLSDVL